MPLNPYKNTPFLNSDVIRDQSVKAMQKFDMKIRTSLRRTFIFVSVLVLLPS